MTLKAAAAGLLQRLRSATEDHSTPHPGGIPSRMHHP
jgi:hypothetical protein